MFCWQGFWGILLPHSVEVVFITVLNVFGWLDGRQDFYAIPLEHGPCLQLLDFYNVCVTGLQAIDHRTYRTSGFIPVAPTCVQLTPWCNNIPVHNFGPVYKSAYRQEAFSALQGP